MLIALCQSTWSCSCRCSTTIMKRMSRATLFGFNMLIILCLSDWFASRQTLGLQEWFVQVNQRVLKKYILWRLQTQGGGWLVTQSTPPPVSAPGVTVTLHVHKGDKLPLHSEWGKSPGETPFSVFQLPQYPGDIPLIHTTFVVPQIGNVKVPKPYTNLLLGNNTDIVQTDLIAMYHVLLFRQCIPVLLCC